MVRQTRAVAVGRAEEGGSGGVEGTSASYRSAARGCAVSGASAHCGWLEPEEAGCANAGVKGSCVAAAATVAAAAASAAAA